MLFSPFSFKNLKLPNRIVMAPMTRQQSPDGVPTEAVAGYYERRARGGVGLIITEGTVVARPAAKNARDIPDFHGDAALAGWKHVVERVHAAGGLIAPQLWHVGNRPRSGPDDGWNPSPLDSPSGHDGADRPPRGEPMTEAAIADTIAAFARAAQAADELGFDAIELHGAHGYLIDQFFWQGTNARTDHWGGPTIADRSRFALEIVKAVRAVIRPELPLILRVSQWKSHDFNARNAASPSELEQWLAPLVTAGVDMVHCSQRRFWEPEFEGSDLNLAGWVKKVTGVPTITVGSIGLDEEFTAALRLGKGAAPAPIDKLIERLERGEFDLVAVGRALLSDPQWAAKIRDGRFDELMAFERSALGTLS